MKYVIYHSSTKTELRITSNQKLVSFRKGMIEFWSFIPLFSPFKMSIGFLDASAWVTDSLVLRILTGQDASAQVTEGLN